MRDRLNLLLRFASATMIFAGYLALGAVYQYGPGIVFIPLILLPLSPLGEYLEAHWAPWRILRRGVVVVYACFIPFSVPMLGLMDAVIALVIFIQAYLLLGIKKERIYYELYLMSFFLLLAAAVQSPEPEVAIALLLYGVSAIWAFAALRMYYDRETSSRRARPEIRPLLRKSRGYRPGNVFDFGVFLSLSALSLLSIALTVAVFLLTPRVEAGWLGRRDSRQSITGISETVRITGGANIAEDQSVVMYVRFPDEEDGIFRPESDLYWRISTLTRFSGDEWSRRGLQHHYTPGVQEMSGRQGHRVFGRDAYEEGRRQRDNARSIRQVIYMDDVPTQGVPVLDLPQGILLLGDPPQTSVSWEGGNDFSLHLQMRGARRLQYEAYSDIVSHSVEALRAAPFDYGTMAQRDYSLLTYQELLPETRQLVRNLTADHTAVYDKVMALNAWLSGPAFTYSLNVPSLPPENGMDAFINDIRRGHCEFFATALALMIRSLGIPARVVSGYRGGDYTPGDQAYIVRASMSHLWVEVLFTDLGWVRVDPSPQSEVMPSAFRRFQMAWSWYAMRGKMFWFQSVIGFEGGMRMDQINWRFWRRGAGQWPSLSLIPAFPELSDDEVMHDYSALLLHPVIRVALWAALLAGIAFLARRWRLARAKIPALSRDQARARRLYLRFLRKAATLGVDCHNKTAGEIEKALMKRSLSEAHTLQAFIACYNAVRFGNHPLSNEQQAQFKTFIRRLRTL